MYRLILVSLLLISGTAEAHSFGKLYTLPVPLWMYTWGASAALVVSFLMVGWLVNHSPADSKSRSIDPGNHALAKIALGAPALRLLNALSVTSLLLCIATGLFGTSNAYLNFNMTFFWIVFLLGFTYFTALFGGLYAAINPWQTITGLSGRLLPARIQGRFRYPEQLGYWPALLFYMAFIWLELFGSSSPLSLSWTLISYFLVNLTGSWLFGPRDWFRYAEFFGLLFRLISRMAPLEYQPATSGQTGGRLIIRAPFIGLLQSRAQSLAELLFVLFILSSTAFDGLHQTDFWARLYWQDIAGWLKPWTGENIVQAYPILSTVHGVFQSLALLFSPLLYLTAYLACLLIMRQITGCRFSVYELALRFAYSLLPIALVYHITHYYTLILTQGAMIIRLASDPFGKGWDIFGTAHMLPKPIIPDMDWVWHTQVWLILLGHILSVYLAHREALLLFPNRKTALMSQLPMLVLMVLFTWFGLWIMAQPITSTYVPQ